MNVTDGDNIACAQVDQRAIELILGDRNYARALPEFSESLSGDSQDSSAEVKTFDLRLDDRITAKD